MQKPIDHVHAVLWVFLLLSMGLVIFLSPLSRDGDIWLHASVGRWLSTHWGQFSLWFEDPYLFSGRSPNEVFNWLSQIVFYFLLEKVGPIGIRIWGLGVVGASLSLIFHRYRQSDLTLPILLSTLVWCLLYGSFDFRPQLIAVFFLTLYALYFFKSLDRTPRLVCVLVANIVWLNFHGSGLVGVFWASCFYLLSYLRFRKPQFLAYAFLCLSSALLTPNHIHFFERILALKQAALSSGIVEWGAPSSFLRLSLALVAVLLLFVRSLSLYQKMFSWMFLSLAALYIRNEIFLLVPLYWVFPFLYQLCVRANKQLAPVLILIVLVWIQPFWLHTPTHLPVHAKIFLQAIGFKGTLLNYPSWGGYLSHELFPSVRMAADNRAYTSRRVLGAMARTSTGRGSVDLGAIAAFLNYPGGVLFPSQINLRASLGDEYVIVFENNVSTLMIHRSQGDLLESAKRFYARHNVPFSVESGFVFKDVAHSVPRWMSAHMEALEISVFAEASWVERDASNEFTFLHTRGMLKQGS